MRKQLLILTLLFTLSAPTQVFATPEDASAVGKRIEALPEPGNAMGSEQREEVEAVGAEYDALSVSDKLLVENREKLATLRSSLEEGAGTDEEETEPNTAEQIEWSDTTVPEEKADGLTHTIESIGEAMSITAYFISDVNGDGQIDTPDLILSDPDGNTIPLSAATVRLKDTNISASTTWDAMSMRLDIEYAKEGTWTLTASAACTFEDGEYKGGQSAFDDTSITGTKEEEKEESGLNIGAMLQSLLPLILLFVGVIFLFVFMRLRGKEKEKKKEGEQKRENIDDRIKPMTDEEELLALREQYADLFEKEDEEEEPAETGGGEEKKTYTMEDLDDDESVSAFVEGNTSVLLKKQEKEMLDEPEEVDETGFFDQMWEDNDVHNG